MAPPRRRWAAGAAAAGAAVRQPRRATARRAPAPPTRRRRAAASRLRTVEPDALTPRAALELLYELKRPERESKSPSRAARPLLQL